MPTNSNTFMECAKGFGFLLLVYVWWRLGDAYARHTERRARERRHRKLIAEGVTVFAGRQSLNYFVGESVRYGGRDTYVGSIDHKSGTMVLVRGKVKP